MEVVASATVVNGLLCCGGISSPTTYNTTQSKNDGGMFATTLQAKSWQIYKSFSSYGLFQEPISMIFPSGSAIKQVRCPHGSVVGSNKDVAPCATAF